MTSSISPTLVLDVQNPSARHFMGGFRTFLYQVVNRADKFGDQSVNEVAIGAFEGAIPAGYQLAFALWVVGLFAP